MNEYKITLAHDQYDFIEADNERLAKEKLRSRYENIYDEKAPKIIKMEIFKTYSNEEYKKYREELNIAQLETMLEYPAYTKKDGKYFANGKEIKTTYNISTVINKHGEEVTKINIT